VRVGSGIRVLVIRVTVAARKNREPSESEGRGFEGLIGERCFRVFG